jgi:triose/dihydroxyacetone kinase / FAD-AMP lyase (cyclizing)
MVTHFVNDASAIVTSALDALIRSAGGALTRLDGYPDIKVVRRSHVDPDLVAVISGGGAGHEPAHAGFVGAGLLTAAVSGEIFASPSVEAVLAAILSVTGDAGCLLVVKNYTGDRLNFGLAAERARAMGLAVAMIVVSDDVALKDSRHPRGLAGTLLVHKVAGAVAESGATLGEVAEVAGRAARSIRTLGISVSGVDIPYRAPARAFAPDTAEIGLGIHGEPGMETIKVGRATQVLGRMSATLEADLPARAPVALLVNNLGGVPALEIGVILDSLLGTPLGERAELIVGPGPLMTSLGMQGFSVSALPLDDGIRAALKAPAGITTSWPTARAVVSVTPLPVPRSGEVQQAEPSDNARLRKLLTAICSALISDQQRLDDLDARIGDGDTGSTFAAAARRVLAEMDQLPIGEMAPLLYRLAQLVSMSMGASSGVLISIMLTAAGGAVERGSALVPALRAGIEAMQKYGGAGPGDRTMLDALLPAWAELEAGRSLAAAATAARGGAHSTAGISRATVGRSAYVPGHRLVGNPDPGAEAVAVVLAAAAVAAEATPDHEAGSTC